MLARLHEDSHPGLAIFQRKPLTTPPASLLRSWINFQSFQRYPPVGRINITMEKNRESYRSKTPFAICQELLSCCYRVTVARSHIKQINLVRGSVCLRPSGFQDLPPPFRLLGSLSRAAWRRIYGRLCSSFILIRRLNENEVAVIAVSRKRDSLNWRAGAL